MAIGVIAKHAVSYPIARSFAANRRTSSRFLARELGKVRELREMSMSDHMHDRLMSADFVESR